MAKNGKFLEAIALQVAAGKTIADAAAEIGCSLSHGYTFSCSPEFRRRVAELRAAMTDRAVGELSAGAAEAVSTLRALAKEGNEPAIRLQASAKLLTLLGPFSETNELRRRLDELERSPSKLRIANVE